MASVLKSESFGGRSVNASVRRWGECMRKPIGFESLCVSADDMSRGPFPPAGFLPVWDAELGNGDNFGLYWPLGREALEPIVCDMYHDEYGLRPAFSTVEKFRAWLDANDGERGEVEVEDSGFALNQFSLARECISEGSAEDAIKLLRQACESVPDISEYWFALAGQLRRSGNINESVDAALCAYRSCWCFGVPSDAVLRMIRSARSNPAFAGDPLVNRSDDLTTKYGGERENQNYAILKDCVDAYIGQGRCSWGFRSIRTMPS